MFRRIEITPGICLHLSTEHSFLRVHLAGFLTMPLMGEVSARALIPSLLVRGTQSFPNSQSLAAQCASLYGAKLASDVFRVGDKQVLEMSLELVGDRCAAESIVSQGASLLLDILTNPHRPHGTFDSKWVEEEKSQLHGELAGLVGDKMEYPLLKARSIVYAGQPAGTYVKGAIDELDSLTADNVSDVYNNLMSSAQIDFYAIGDFDEESLVDAITSKLAESNQVRQPIPITASTAASHTGARKIIRESQSIEQGCLVLAYTGDVTMANDSDSQALSLVSSIFGGSPVSKLFRNVREKESMAYAIHTICDEPKGAIFAYAAIDPANRQVAVDLMTAQFQEIAEGAISEEELLSAKKHVINGLLAGYDDPNRLAVMDLRARVEGCSHDISLEIKAIEKLSSQEIADVAKRLDLAAEYFLSGE